MSSGTATFVDDREHRTRDRRNYVALGSAAVLTAYVVVALVGHELSPYDPNELGVGPPLSPPSSDHWFGTDELGRDQLSRVIAAVRIAIVVAFSSVGIALVLGASFGVAAGYLRGKTDTITMRGMDVLFAFPELILAIIVIAALGPSTLTAVIAIAIVYVPRFARVARVSTVTVEGNAYIEAARIASIGVPRIVVRHVIPNIRGPLIVLTSLSMSTAQLAYATLSFLGFGARPPQADFGSMLAASRNFMTFDPWLVICPGLVLVVLIVAFNLCGDAVRDALDPHFWKEMA